MNIKLIFNTFVLSTLLLVGSVLAEGQASRTWVSGVGDDANPCSRTAPCKTFAGAISKTVRGGEIDALDPAGYGAVTITKSITIDGCCMTSILAAGTNAIVINITDPADTAKTVRIRNLSINGINGSPSSAGLNGIRLIATGNLFIEHCAIFGFGNAGIDFEPAGGAGQLWVTDSIVTSNNGGGILVKPGAGGTATASLDTVRMEKNTGAGLRAEDNSKVTVRDSVSANNTGNGFLAFSASAAIELNLESVVTTHNLTNGVKSEGANAVVRLSNSTVVNNNTGLTSASGGQFLSFFNNKVAGNNPGGDGVTPPTTPLK